MRGSGVNENVGEPLPGRFEPRVVSSGSRDRRFLARFHAPRADTSPAPAVVSIGDPRLLGDSLLDEATEIFNSPRTPALLPIEPVQFNVRSRK